MAQTTKFIKIFIFPHITYHNKITNQIFYKRLARSEIFSEPRAILVLTSLTYNCDQVDIIIICWAKGKDIFLI